MSKPHPDEEPAASAPLADGDAFGLGRYRLFAKLGSGGQADVYLAVARGTLGVDKLVVIKKAKQGVADDAALLAMFLDEARLALRLNHPNVVHTYEVGEEKGTHFLSMEYVEGLSLREMFRDPRARRFGPEIWLRIAADALSGLQHAHALHDYDGTPLNIVHRDVSPQNILVTYEGVTKILDFGIAKAALSNADTETGVLKGKASYMAPEQALGTADARSDLFAMGIVLWEVLSGARLFPGDFALALHKLGNDPIPRLRTVMPDVDPEIDEIVARALEKEPERRFQSANEMRLAIERFLRRTGQPVREAEVGEAISSTFHETRARVQARIQRAMADLAAPPQSSGDLPALTSSRDRASDVDASGERGIERRGTTVAERATLAGGGAPRRRALLVAIAVGMAATIGWVVDLTAKTRTSPPAPVAAAAAAPTRAPCRGPIRVRVMYDMTGSTKDVGQAAGKGEWDYLRAIDAEGGIRGCLLDIDVQDTKYDKRASLDVYAAWRARPDWPEVSAIFVQGTPMTQVLAPLAAEDEKTIISGAYAGELAAPAPTGTDVEVPSLGGNFNEASLLVRKQSPGYPYVFFQGTDYTTAARVAANFAWRQGAKRMAFFYCTTSAFCTEPVDGAKTFLKLLGGTQIGRDLAIELDDGDDAIARKVIEFFRQEKAHKRAAPDYDMVDWIWFGNTNTNSAALGKALKKLKEELSIDVHVIGNNWSVDEALRSRCGDACTGFYVVQPYAMFGDLTASGMTALLGDHKTYRAIDHDPEDSYKTVQYVYGRVAVATWRIAVERLLDAGKPVTGETLRRELESFRNVDVEGFATISYSATDHRPQSGARIAQLAGRGRLDPIGQPLALSLQKGWLGW